MNTYFNGYPKLCFFVLDMLVILNATMTFERPRINQRKEEVHSVINGTDSHL